MKEKIKKAKDLFIAVPILLSIFFPLTNLSSNTPLISPLSLNNSNISLNNEKKGYEVFGFAPYWNFDKLDNVDFSTLTTLAYFDIPIDGSGNFDTYDVGYQTFMSDKATKLFKKAHSKGTRVVVTLTQMNNYDIASLMDDPNAQNNLIKNTTALVKKRGLDGVNIDFEYVGDPGDEYRNKFSNFVKNFTNEMHKEIPGSKVTVSVYASAIKDPKIYDIKTVAINSDGIFMMAYDFAVANSENAIPTSPLYGHKKGEYWYDVSTAVDDFLTVMPSDKLILGLPWYGYDYAVSEPGVKAQTQGYYSYYWWGGRRYTSYVPSQGFSQTYKSVQDNITPQATGWDDNGKVGWKAYIRNGAWRMIFIEDTKSLRIKYDFAKEKNLAGVGIWALGNDSGKREMWDLLSDEFGKKLVDSSIVNKKINENI